jgi:hypothetical protein
MRELGHVDGKNMAVAARFAESRPERVPDLVAELLRLNVEVIVAAGGPVYRVLQRTPAIPPTLKHFRRAAIFVDKILKGARPGELPFEQPTRYVRAVNQKTAAGALGLTLPPSLITRADHVVE